MFSDTFHTAASLLGLRPSDTAHWPFRRIDSASYSPPAPGIKLPGFSKPYYCVGLSAHCGFSELGVFNLGLNPLVLREWLCGYDTPSSCGLPLCQVFVSRPVTYRSHTDCGTLAESSLIFSFYHYWRGTIIFHRTLPKPAIKKTSKCANVMSLCS